MSDQATPRPWRYVAEPRPNGGRPWHCIDAEAECPVTGDTIECTLGELYGPFQKDQETVAANAALIVRAVNAHDALVEALEKIASPNHWSVVEPTDHEGIKAALIFDEMQRIARAALDAAKGDGA